MAQLNQKVAIVTGGGSGIGRAISLEFAKEGAHVAVCGLDKVEKVAEEIRALGGTALGLTIDVSIKEEVQKLVRRTIDELGKIDILVNNAGILRSASILQMTEEMWDKVLDVNLKGAFLCTQTVAKHMLKQRYGKIIIISSISGRGGGMGGGVNYDASKAALIQFTKSAAYELGPYGINVNSIAPGTVIYTDLPRPFKTPEEFNKFVEMKKAQTVTRKIGMPEDIAKLAVFLASEGASFISGQTVPIDGGRTDRM